MSTVRFKVAPVWKGDYDPSVIYNISDEVRDLDGTGVYRSLINENNKPLADNSAWVHIVDLTELKEVTIDSTNVNETIKANENLRVSSENVRKIAENTRVANEETRVANENNRKQNEVNRQDAESSRRTAETARTSAENTRIANENARKSNETTRQSNESARVSAENTRKSNETARVSSENTRTQNETNRQSSESTRQNNEQTRQTNEQARQTNEGSPNDAPNPSGSRWARYKDAENGRNLTFTNNEGAATDTPSSNGSRWARFKKGDADRENTFVTNEGTPNDEASDTGSRWARYKKAEESRSAAITDLQENKADKEGEFPKLIAGSAKNLESRELSEGEFISRTSGGEAEIATGVGQLEGVKGNSIKFNQLCSDSFVPRTINGITFTKNGDGSYTVNGTATSIAMTEPENKPYIIAKHKYAILGGDAAHSFLNVYDQTKIGSKGVNAPAIINVISSGTIGIFRLFVSQDITLNNYKFYPMFIDLTAIFGSDANIAAALGITEAQITTDLGVAAFESWLERTVGKQPYYAYNPGEVINVNMTGLESVSRNLLDSNGNAHILGTYSEDYESYYGITGTHGAITFTNNNGETSTITPDSEGKFLLEESGTLHVATPGEDCSVFIWWDGSKTDYTDHKSNVAKLDVKHIYGKLNGEGDLVQVYPYGMCGIGDVKDELGVVDGVITAEKAYTHLNMGTANWVYKGDANNTLYVSAQGVTAGLKILCPKYQNTSVDLGIYAVNNLIRVIDSSYSDASTFKTAMAGVILHYELATPQIYTELVYQGSELYPDGTPVTLPVEYEVDNWGIENILPKNTLAVNTAMPTIISKYSVDAIETMKTLDDKIEAKPNTNGSYPNISVGTADKLNGVNPIDSEFVARQTGHPNKVSSGLARITEVRGKSLVWNQLRTEKFIPDTQNVNYSISNNGRYNVITRLGNSSQIAVTLFQDNPSIVGHKVLYKFNTICTDTWSADITMSVYGITLTQLATTGTFKGIGVATRNEALYRRLLVNLAEEEDVNKVFNISPIICVDLTLMFGAGNEPTTVEEFEAIYNGYHDYNPGEIVNNATESIETIGFNQWDEELEEGGIDNVTGLPIADNNCLRCKNFIPVLSNTTYFIKAPIFAASYIRFFCYDSSERLLSIENWINGNMPITTPVNTHYMRFKLAGSYYGTTYNNDICINISDPAKNGTYEPYKRNLLPLNLTTITGKSATSEESEVIFPEGLRSAGEVYDTLVVDDDGYARKAIVRIGKVDLGSLTWNYNTESGHERFVASLVNAKTATSDVKGNLLSTVYVTYETNIIYAHLANKAIGISGNSVLAVYDTAYTDAAAFKTAMDGVELAYELATPIEYTLDTPIYFGYQAYSGGIERRLPEDTQAKVTAPFAGKIIYPINAVKQLLEMPKDYDTIGSLDNLTAALATTLSQVLNGNLTITRGEFDTVTNKYEFTVTFTPNE